MGFRFPALPIEAVKRSSLVSIELPATSSVIQATRCPAIATWPMSGWSLGEGILTRDVAPDWTFQTYTPLPSVL
jgi:hypothetical protein